MERGPESDDRSSLVKAVEATGRWPPIDFTVRFRGRWFKISGMWPSLGEFLTRRIDLVLQKADQGTPPAEPVEQNAYVLEAPEGYVVRDTDDQSLAPGMMAPAWRLKALSGRTVSLVDLAGRVVVMDFWNTWCFVCGSLMPGLARLAEEFRDAPVSFVAVNVFEVGDPVAYWEAKGYRHDVLLDGDDVLRRYGFSFQPDVAVVDPRGRLVHLSAGADADRNAQVKAAIIRALTPTPLAGGSELHTGCEACQQPAYSCRVGG